MKKVSSPVWKFFERICDKNGRCTTVVCKLCDNQYKFFGNTTNLRVHLTKKHPVQWDLLQTDASFAADITIPASPVNTSTGKRRNYKSNAKADQNVRYTVTVNDEDSTGNKVPKIEIKPVENNSDDTDQEDEETTLNLVRQMHGDQNSDEEWLEEDPYQITHIETYEPQTKRKRKFRKIKREIPSPTGLPGYYVAPKSEKVVIEKPTKDEYSVFGEYVANKLRKIKTPRTRGNLQQLITTILWQADYGLYDSADVVKRVLLMNLHADNDFDAQPVQSEIHVVAAEEIATASSPDGHHSRDSVSLINN